MAPLPLPIGYDALSLILGGTIGAGASSLLGRRRNGSSQVHAGADLLLTRHVPAVTWSVNRELRLLGARGGEGVLFGLHFDGSPGAHVCDLVEKDQREAFETAHLQALRGSIHTIEGLFFKRWYRVALEPARDSGGTIVGVNGVALDITELQEARDQIVRERHVDDLTGLATRVRFYDRLGQALRMSARTKKHTAVFAVDIDRFKLINEMRGHTMGDELLKSVADRLRAILRKADTVARLGSDDFAAVVLDVETAENAAIVAEKITLAFKQPFIVEGEQIHASVSTGIALAPHDGEDELTLLRNAETALSFAKVTGGNVFHFYAHSMHERISERAALESALRTALDTGEMDVFYQPIVDGNAHIEGFEALVRWNHALLGRLSPDRFIPLAEETGLIVPLGELVLRRACHDIHALQRRTGLPLRVAVNISARQFDDARLVDRVERIIAESEIDPSLVELELTESTLMADMDAAIGTLGALKKLGVSLAIDDFGTGYSSLSYLKRLPIDTLKVDRSFVSELPDDENATAIVGAVCSLAHALGLRVVAEGVETPDQVDALLRLQSDLFQGYFFGRPVSIEEVISETINLPIFRDRIASLEPVANLEHLRVFHD